jgi:protein SCO1/2
MLRTPIFLVFALCLTLGLATGCRKSAAPATASSAMQQKSFTLRGTVVSTDATHVTLDHEAVPGFMEAMIMPYKLKDPSIVSELHPGDRITATLHVDEDEGGFHNAVLDNIVVIAQARPDYKPAVQYHVPTPGDAVPNFKLLNQSDREDAHGEQR